MSELQVGNVTPARLHLLAEVHKVAGEDEAEEADVERRDELLAVDVDHGAQQSPGAALSIHVQHSKQTLTSQAIVSCDRSPRRHDLIYPYDIMLKRKFYRA